MLCWPTVSLASFLLLVSLEETICGTLPKTGIHLKPLFGHGAPAAGINQTIVDAHASNNGHASPAPQNIPHKAQPAVRRKAKLLNGILESNDTATANILLPRSKGASKHHQDTHSGQQTSFMAFTVSNEGSDQGPYEADKIVTFNQVITNTGGGFDPIFSVFTSKVSGHYFFSLSIQATSQTNAKVYLVHDGKNIVHAVGHYPHYTASLSACFRLGAGGRVWVSLTKGWAVHGAHSSFSGYLVNPDAATGT